MARVAIEILAPPDALLFVVAMSAFECGCAFGRVPDGLLACCEGNGRNTALPAFKVYLDDSEGQETLRSGVHGSISASATACAARAYLDRHWLAMRRSHACQGLQSQEERHCKQGCRHNCIGHSSSSGTTARAYFPPAGSGGSPTGDSRPRCRPGIFELGQGSEESHGGMKAIHRLRGQNLGHFG